MRAAQRCDNARSPILLPRPKGTPSLLRLLGNQYDEWLETRSLLSTHMSSVRISKTSSALPRTAGLAKQALR